MSNEHISSVIMYHETVAFLCILIKKKDLSKCNPVNTTLLLKIKNINMTHTLKSFSEHLQLYQRK